MGSEDNPTRYIILGIGILVVSMIFFGSWYTISAGQRGIVLTLGKPSDVVSMPGFHFKIPIVQNIVKVSIQTLKYSGEASAASSDLQTVTTNVAINYHLNSNSVVDIYTKIGMGYSDTIINPLEQEVVKAITAKYTAEELITKRENVRADIETALQKTLEPRGIIVESISITNFKFSDTFEAAIEGKVTAEQNALAAKNKLDQIQYEAQQAKAQANGQSEAMQLVGNDRYVQLQAIQKWNGIMPLAVGGNSMPFISIPTTSNNRTA